ncbi:MAG: hypothetical protein E6G94_14175 [Alphaproteobacteria bacterium]|nr:MAG: hypothetical protein E6G94_14175 [Alphaproteobacteria bacterium]
MIRKPALALAALALLAGPAAAQIAPGIRTPDNVAEAVLMAQLFGCTAAASERLAGGLNAPLAPDLKGVELHSALPPVLAPKVGPLAEGSKVMSLSSPEGSVWMAYDPTARRCVVSALAPDPAAVKAKLMPVFESGRSPWKSVGAKNDRLDSGGGRRAGRDHHSSLQPIVR